MPFTNFNSRHFEAADKDQIFAAISDLESALSDKLANLSPEERQQYGSVNEQNKLIINKVKDYHATQPNLSSADVDWEEFLRDFDSRVFLQSTMQRMQSLLDEMGNAKILHDYDNYRAALTDYEYAKYKNGTQTAGYETKVNELKQFFTGGNPGAAAKTATPPAEPTP